MNATEAAVKLSESLRDKPWLVSTGVGTKDSVECVYLYVTKTAPNSELDPSALLKGTGGIPVVVSRSGKFRPTS